jgi:selenide,water dikinase
MGPGTLAQVLRPLAIQHHPQLLVGLATSDDAAVYQLRGDLALIQTVDFFPPVVDDPFAYGGIAAANAMSDIYAMGGEVTLGLNIAAWPDSLPPTILTEIFAGGAAQMASVGAVIAGGHTVTDDEPKYGLCVTGVIHPDKILTKANAQVGDRLYLTKAIGTGIVLTALKREAVDPTDLDAATTSMLRLNRQAAQLVQQVGIHACTDITGFGLLGHALEMAEKSGVRLRIVAEQVPLLPGARGYAEAGFVPGGIGRNRDYFATLGDHGVTFPADLPQALNDLLHDPQTSGGLLISLPAERAATLEVAFAEAGATLWPIGDVVAGAGLAVVGEA